MPSLNYHTVDIRQAPQDAERARQKLPNGVILNRAKIGGDWTTTSVYIPAGEFDERQAKRWAEQHEYEGEFHKATGERHDAAEVPQTPDVPVLDDAGKWDGDAERKRLFKWATGDDDKVDFAKARPAFGLVEGDPDVQGSYKYQTLVERNGRLYIHPQAVRTALAMASGARSGQAVGGEAGDKLRARLKRQLDKVHERADSDLEVSYRVDSYAGLAKPVRRPDGTLLLQGTLARPGVLQYQRGDGTVRRELVPETTLRDVEWLRSVARAPVALEHPVQDGKLVDVTPENVQKFGVGDVDGDVLVDEDDYVRIKLAARRQDAIRDLDTGRRRELSPGYSCGYDPTPGTHPVYGEYDGVQLWRRCNHVALTEAARGGNTIGVRTDSRDVWQAVRDAEPTEDTMNKELLEALVKLGLKRDAAERIAKADSVDGVATSLSEATRGDASAREMYDEVAAELRDMKKERDQLKGKLDKATADMEAMKEDAKKGDSDEDRIAWFNERRRLMDLAATREIDKADSLSNGDLLRAVAKADNDKLSDDVSEDYLRGYVDSLEAEPKADSDQPPNPWATLNPPPRRGDGQQQQQGPTGAPRHDADPYTVQQRNMRGEQAAR